MWSVLVVRNCAFVDNESESRGGAIAARLVALPDQLLIESCQFERNAAYGGGGLWVDTFSQSAELAKARISDCRFVSNRASREGGGVSFGYQANGILIENSRFEKNRADRGGGLDLGYESRLQVRECVITENVADTGGGASGSFSYEPRPSPTAAEPWTGTIGQRGTLRLVSFGGGVIRVAVLKVP